jgi:uncharacterized protein YqeY
MALKTDIQDDMKAAMRAGDKERLGTIRMVLAAIKQREVDTREDVSDADVLQLLEKMVKQRRESAEQYRSGKRPELAEREEREIEFIRVYMPEPLSDEDLQALIAEAIANAGATSMKDMGKVMGLVKAQAQGRADMGKVSAAVKERLSAA